MIEQSQLIAKRMQRGAAIKFMRLLMGIQEGDLINISYSKEGEGSIKLTQTEMITRLQSVQSKLQTHMAQIERGVTVNNEKAYKEVSEMFAPVQTALIKALEDEISRIKGITNI